MEEKLKSTPKKRRTRWDVMQAKELLRKYSCNERRRRGKKRYKTVDDATRGHMKLRKGAETGAATGDNSAYGSKPYHIFIFCLIVTEPSTALMSSLICTANKANLRLKISII